jgi:hypothetical protein
MGLTIHWTLQAPPDAAASRVRELMDGLRSGCMDLPFDSVSEVFHLQEEEIAARLESRQDPLRWFLIQAGTYLVVDRGLETERHARLDPVEVIGFATTPGRESEDANFALARFPASVTVAGREHATGLAGWHGGSFCKTQYASGVSSQEFLQCHLAVIAALDHAASLGLLKSVNDEGEFWQHRNAETLLKTVGEWNQMMAAFVGGLELATGASLPAPIKAHPQFERLEHLGTTEKTAAMVKAIADALKRKAKEKD